jgi:hypothetical protein
LGAETLYRKFGFKDEHYAHIYEINDSKKESNIEVEIIENQSLNG